MIKTFKTFSSLVLLSCMLSLWVSSFFVPAETPFASELSSMPCSSKLRSLMETVFGISCGCLLVLSSFYLVISLLAHTGTVVLGLVRFCARTVAGTAGFVAAVVCSVFDLLLAAVVSPFDDLLCVIITCNLPLLVRFIFAAAEIQFGPEFGSWLGSGKLQALAETVFGISCGCLLVLSSFFLVISLLAHTGTIVLGMMRFCARIVAGTAGFAPYVLIRTGVVVHEMARICACFAERGCACVYNNYKGMKRATLMYGIVWFVPFEESPRATPVSSVDHTAELLSWWLSGFVLACLLLPVLEFASSCLAACLTRFAFELDGFCAPAVAKGLAYAATVLQATSRSTLQPVASKQSRRAVLRAYFFFFVLAVLLGVVGVLLGGQWTRCIAISLVFVAAELQRPSAATESLHSAPVYLFEKLSWKILANQRPLHLRLRKIVVPRRRFLTNLKQKAGARVSFASGQNLKSHRIIEGRSKEDNKHQERFLFKQKVDEAVDERDFEIFESEDFSDDRMFPEMVKMPINFFTEETFFLDQEGERRHPGHWKGFRDKVLPNLPVDQAIPGFSCFDEYARYLRFYDNMYRTCLMWYENRALQLKGGLVSENDEELADVTEQMMDEGAESGSLFIGDEVETEDTPMEMAPAQDNGSLNLPLQGVEEVEEKESLFEDETMGAVTVLLPHSSKELKTVTPCHRTRTYLSRKCKEKLEAFVPCHRTRTYLSRKCKENVHYTR